MENNYYQQPAAVNPPVKAPAPQKPKKNGGALGKQHILLGVSIILGYKLIPFLSSTITNFIISLIGNIPEMKGNYFFDDSFSNLYYAVSNVCSNVSAVVQNLLIVAVYIALGYFAYKKLGKTACFVGVAFIATKLAGFLAGIFNTLVSLVVVIITAIEESAYYDVLAVTNIINVLISLLGLVIAVAAGVFLLMFVEKGKLNIKKKKKVAPAPVPSQTV